jgi:type II secretory pathway pseudopilin PulG
MRDVTEDNTFMRSSQSDASGFIMVVLLIVMGIGAVWMAASLPTWKQQATREKEAELVFRGRQYVRALSLYERKNGPGAKPASIDILVDNKFLRKKYKDPMTNDDFMPLYASSAPLVPGQAPGGGQAAPGQQQAGRAGQPTAQAPAQQGRAGAPAAGQPGQAGQAGGSGVFGGQIIGVVSKSTATSIMVFAGATHYNEWQFVYQGGRAGAPGGPGGANPGRGGPGGGPTGPGIGGPGRGGGQIPTGPGRGGAPLPTGPGRGRGGT